MRVRVLPGVPRCVMKTIDDDFDEKLVPRITVKKSPYSKGLLNLVRRYILINRDKWLLKETLAFRLNTSVSSIGRALQVMIAEGLIEGPLPVPAKENGKDVVITHKRSSLTWREGHWVIYSQIRSLIWDGEDWVSASQLAKKKSLRENVRIPIKYNLDSRYQRRKRSSYHAATLSSASGIRRRMSSQAPGNSEYTGWDGKAYRVLFHSGAFQSAFKGARITFDKNGKPSMDSSKPKYTCNRCGGSITKKGRHALSKRKHSKGLCNLNIIQSVLEI